MHHKAWVIVVVLLALGATGVVSDGAGTPVDAPPVSRQPAQTQLPTECLLEKNQGACVQCCKAALPGLPANICSHFCKAVVPPPPGEPQP